MPSVARRVRISTTARGLHVAPASRLQDADATNGALLEWRGLQTLSDSALDKNEDAFYCHGVVGLFEAFGSAYLLAVSSVDKVACISGSDVFKITGVVTIPLASRQEASLALNGLINSQRAKKHETEEPLAFLAGAFDAGEAEDDEPVPRESWSTETRRPRSRRASHNRGRSIDAKSISEEIYRNTGAMGKGDTRFRIKRDLGPVPLADLPRKSSELANETGDLQRPATEHGLVEAGSRDDMAVNTIPRVLFALRSLLSCGSFFFSFDFDITRSLADAEPKAKNLPLWRRVKSTFFWNEHLMRHFIEDAHDALVLPIMQGFVGQRRVQLQAGKVGTARKTEPTSDKSETDRSLPIPQEFDLTLISRRSVRRNGLRYLRRGIDSSGAVANFVETEQLLTSASNAAERTIQSFVQIRGSIPLFFTQSPFSLKPVPVMRKSQNTNAQAFASHIHQLGSQYGNVHAISLVNKHGNEQAIGEAYSAQADAYVKNASTESGSTRPALTFDWVDFHALCKGMRFDKVSVIVDMISEFLNVSGWTSRNGDMITRKQNGVVRTNCMDCLDRTNVVQAALAQHVLQMQLSEATGGVDEVKLQDGPATVWFDTLWADNGDAISTAYTSTAALKGDYVRTRTRNWYGVLNDARLSVARFYHNMFSDFFLQGVIDYSLGLASETIFQELESGLALQILERDYEHDERYETLVLSQEKAAEGCVAGWLLDQIRADSIERVIFLLVEGGLSRVRYDWDESAVLSRDFVSAEKVQKLVWGTLLTEVGGMKSNQGEQSMGMTIKLIDGEEEWTFKLPWSKAQAAKRSARTAMGSLVEETCRWLEACSQEAIEVREMVLENERETGWVEWMSRGVQRALLG